MTYELLYEHETPMYQRRLVLPPPSIFLDLPTIFPNLFSYALTHTFTWIVYTRVLVVSHIIELLTVNLTFFFFFTHTFLLTTPQNLPSSTHILLLDSRTIV